MIGEIINFLKDAVKDLWDSKQDATWRLPYSSDLAIFVGWSSGYDPKDATNPAIKGLVDKDGYSVCVKIGINSRDDFDYIDMPFYEDGEVYNTEIGLTQFDIDDNFRSIAKSLYDSLRELSQFEIDEDGMIIE